MEAWRIRRRLDRNAVRRVRETVLRDGIDILHATHNNAIVTAIRAARGLPVKVVIYRGAFGNPWWRDAGAFLTYRHPRIDRVICVADAVRDSLNRLGIPKSKTVTIYKGHDVEWYGSNDDITVHAPGIPRGAFVVGCAASFRRQKGGHILVEALRHVPNELCVHVLLIGNITDPKLRRVVAAGAMSDRVHAIGHVKEAARLMGRCDAMTALSIRREGLSRAAIEAMSKGIPVVASNIGGLPELVVDGECGIIVPPGDPAATAQAIMRLAKNRELATRMGQAGRERIQSHFHVAQTVEKTLALYESLVG